jgi:histidine triad (HIT) family protein
LSLSAGFIAGEIPASKVYEDGEVFAFNDINPQAPLHVLMFRTPHRDR